MGVRAAEDEGVGLAGARDVVRVLAAADLLNRNPSPSEEEVRHGLEGNLCRCTGYHNIVKAIAAAADVMHGKRSELARAAE